MAKVTKNSPYPEILPDEIPVSGGRLRGRFSGNRFCRESSWRLENGDRTGKTCRVGRFRHGQAISAGRNWDLRFRGWIRDGLEGECAAMDGRIAAENSGREVHGVCGTFDSGDGSGTVWRGSVWQWEGRPDCGGCCGTVRTGEFLPGGLAAGETGKRAVSRGICFHEEAELSAATWEEKRVLPPGRAARAASNFAPCGQRVGALHSKRICLRGINYYRSCFVVGNSRSLSARSVCGAAADRGGAGRGYVTVSRGAEASCRPCRTMPGNTRGVPSGKGRVAAKPNRRHRKTMSGGRTSPNRYCRAGLNLNSRHGSTVSGVFRKSLMGAVGRGGFGVGTRNDAFGAWSALAYVCRKIRFPAVGRRAGSLRHRCGRVALIACGSGGSLRREAAIRQSGRAVMLTVRSAAFAVWRQYPAPPRG